MRQTRPISDAELLQIIWAILLLPFDLFARYWKKVAEIVGVVIAVYFGLGAARMVGVLADFHHGMSYTWWMDWWWVPIARLLV